MKKALPLLFLALFCVWSGCVALNPGVDAVEVRAEQTVQTAFDVFDTFLRLDAADRDLVKRKAPAAHEFAEWLRAPVPNGAQTVPRGVSLILSANRVRLTYKASRTGDNRAQLNTALVALAAAITETQKQLAAVNLTPPR